MSTTILARLAAVSTALLLLMGSGASHADDQYLVFNALALHFKNADERNAAVPGIGWEYSPSGKVGYHIGTLSDSFGYQAKYGGLNYATPRYAALGGRVRFIVGATIVNKQFHKNSEPETKILPLPAMELALTKRAVLNVSGSPQVDFANQRNNAVLFFQFKLNLR